MHTEDTRSFWMFLGDLCHTFYFIPLPAQLFPDTRHQKHPHLTSAGSYDLCSSVQLKMVSVWTGTGKYFWRLIRITYLICFCSSVGQIQLDDLRTGASHPYFLREHETRRGDSWEMGGECHHLKKVLCVRVESRGSDQSVSLWSCGSFRRMGKTEWQQNDANYFCCFYLFCLDKV